MTRVPHRPPRLDRITEIPPDRIVALARVVLGAGAALRFRARGQSMAPAIRDGDEVEVEPPPFGLRVGDILMVQAADGSFLLHRLVRVETGCGNPIVRTKGDRVASPDEPVPSTAVLGRVRWVHTPRGRKGLGGPAGLLLAQLSMLAARAPGPLRSLLHAVISLISWSTRLSGANSRR